MGAAKVLQFSKIAGIRARIHKTHAAIQKDQESLRALVPTLIGRYVEMGELLSEAKREAGHGNWTKWARENLPFGTHQASKYIAASKNKDELLTAANRNCGITISLEGVLGLLRSEEDEAIEPQLGAMRRLKFSGDCEFYTPAEIIEQARKLFDGQIDLDPASCSAANKVVKARRYFTKEVDGLTKQSRGNVWINPPYQAGKIPAFLGKLSEEIDAGRATQALVLLPSWSETAAYVRAVNESSCYLFFEKRLNFWKSDGSTGRAPNGQTLFYFGRRKAQFKKLFKQFGPICTRL